MSGVGSRETGLDSLFASKPVGPGFEPCLGQSAKLAGAPKPLCLSVCLYRLPFCMHVRHGPLAWETVSSSEILHMQCPGRIFRISEMEHVVNAQILARAILRGTDSAGIAM